MLCLKCGKELEDGNQSCVHCGHTTSVSTDSSQIVDDRFSVIDCIKKGWNLAAKSPVVFISSTLVVFLVYFIIGGVYDLIGTRLLAGATEQLYMPDGINSEGVLILKSYIVRFIALLTGYMIGSPLFAGLYIMALRGANNGKISMGRDLFGGFRRYWKVFFVCIIPAIIISLFWFIVICLLTMINVLFLKSVAFSIPSTTLPMLVIVITLMIIVALGWIFIKTCYFYALPLVLDQNISVWRALKESTQASSSHTFKLLLLGMIILICGVLALGVGVLFAIPVYICTKAVAYQHCFYSKNRLP